MIALAALLTFLLTTVFAMAGVGAAFILIPVFLAFGVECTRPWRLHCCSMQSPCPSLR